MPKEGIELEVLLSLTSVRAPYQPVSEAGQGNQGLASTLCTLGETDGGSSSLHPPRPLITSIGKGGRGRRPLPRFGRQQHDEEESATVYP